MEPTQPIYRVLRPGDKVGERGRFEIQSILGQGAFGEVFKGIDRKLERAIAIKHLKHDAWQNQDARNRFWQEAKILARLEHPHIVRIYDLDEVDALIVLELASNGTLEERLSPKRPGFNESVRMIREVLEALDAVHDLCIWHRDLKPANILLSDNDRVLVSDFGVAHAPTDSTYKMAHTSFGQLGTPMFMSPEQLRGDPIDGRSDLYAVGAIMYQLLTGLPHLPFWTLDSLPVGQAIVKLREMVGTQDPKPPADVNRDVPKSLSDIVVKSLRRHVNDRYRTAAEMEEALRLAALDLAGRPSAPEVRKRGLEGSETAHAQAAKNPVGKGADRALSADETAALEAAKKHAAEQNHDAVIAGLEKHVGKKADWRLVEPLVDAYLAKRRYQDGLRVLASLQSRPPDFFELKGACYARLGRPEESVASYREGSKAHPKAARLRELLAVALHKVGKKKEALAELERASELDPQKRSVRRLLKAWKAT